MNASVGDKIKDLREQRNMTQGELADLVGVHQSKISHCETGARGISFELAVKIAGALGVKVDELAPESLPESLEVA
jgi:transcriptional regulator with XRE-family HTH domain